MSLTARVNSVCKALVSVVSCVERLAVFGDQRDESVDERSSFYDVLSNETEVLDILVSIMNGLSANSTEMDKYLSYWDKYKFLWDVDKDAFLRRYSKANRPLSQYNIDITRYRDQQAAVQGEELATSILFMRAECAWASKGVIEWYVKDCRKHCSTSFSLVEQFKTQDADIAKACRSMSKLRLLSLKRNYVYDDGVFVAEQDIHRKRIRERLQQLRRRIEKNIREMYTN